VSFFPKAALAIAGALIVLPVAPAALADIFGPDLRVEGQRLKTTVGLTVFILPSYSTPKPGVTVTMTNCKFGQRAPIRLVRRFGTLGSGQSLHGRPGNLVWELKTVPAKPAKPKLRLGLAVPKGVKTFCIQTSMYDNFTKKIVKTTNRVPL
jgi:hypothetical protein